MKSHVNSGTGNTLKFFIHKPSRGIQELVLKYQRWKLKRSVYYCGGFPVQSWVRLVIFLCLSLLTAKQSYPCFLFRESERLLFQATQNEGTQFYSVWCPEISKWIQKDWTNPVPVSNGSILWPRCNFCLGKSQENKNSWCADFIES